MFKFLKPRKQSVGMDVETLESLYALGAYNDGMYYSDLYNYNKRPKIIFF